MLQNTKLQKPDSKKLVFLQKTVRLVLLLEIEENMNRKMHEDQIMICMKSISVQLMAHPLDVSK